MIQITITDPVQIAGAEAIAGSEADAQTYLQNMLETMCGQWALAYKVGTVLSGDFVLRFTSAEFAEINTAAETDPIVAGFVERVRESPEVVLYSDEVQQGMAYLVAESLLTQDRADEITQW